jgi:hypothetical protein
MDKKDENGNITVESTYTQLPWDQATYTQREWDRVVGIGKVPEEYVKRHMTHEEKIRRYEHG